MVYALFFKLMDELEPKLHNNQVAQNSHLNFERFEQLLLSTRSSLAKSSITSIKTLVSAWIPRSNLYGSIDIEEKDLITFLSDTRDSVDFGADFLTKTGKREKESK